MRGTKRSAGRAPRTGAGSGGAPTITGALALAAGLLAGAMASPGPAAAQEDPYILAEDLEAFRFRSIGPAVTGGRIHDVEALPDDPATIYVATASGGLWKTTNKGTTWTPIFEGRPVSTFGDVAVAPSDPEVIWAGTGEQQNRQSTSWGNGVYRSTDGGGTWTHLGLGETRHIGKVVVHPDDPEVAWVAAQGNLWRGSDDRGVYRTVDGGETWEKVLAGENEYTGAVDLEIDPSNPDVLYAAMYQRLRRTWGFNGGGPGSGIFRTADGGETWEELTAGIPSGDKGRIGLAISRSNPRILNALVEHAGEGGTYRSEDGGESWEKVNDLNPRPMYYSHVFIDPVDPDRVYVLSTEAYTSADGGRSFRRLPTRPTYDVGVHSDHHTLWIDPGDPEHFYLAGDAGLHETWDRGETYDRINNFAIGQFYAIGVDMRTPYRVYGGMQDNHSWMGPSATRHWIGILNDDWRQIGFGDGMYQQPDPETHRYVYVLAQNGTIHRVDAETGDRLDVAPLETGEEEHRFDWVTPAIVSGHDPQVVYLGGNRLFISRDRGHSWTATEDLTRRIDRDTLELMGVPGEEITLSKNDGTASYGEITTISESPLDPDVLWVGTDDGNVQVSRDGGETWREVAGNVPGLPGRTYVSRVVASVRGTGVAYAAFDAHRQGDFEPYVYRTDDRGRTWESLVRPGLAAAGSVNELVEHPENPDLLFLGTEHHLYVTVDGGGEWMLFPGLPTTLYDDLVIHPRENDLVVGTHGRSIRILDDVTPLVEWRGSVPEAPLHLFPIRPATIFQYWKDTSYRGQAAFAGENPPRGAIVTYRLATPVEGVRLEVRSDAGELVRTLDVPSDAGTHRVVWDLRHEPPPFELDEDDREAEAKVPHPLHPRGPFVSPGLYTVRVVAGERTAEETVEVRGDPEMPLTVVDHREREAFLLEVLALQRRAWDAEARVDGMVEEAAGGSDEREALEDLRTRARRLRYGVYSLAGDFNGSGVQQGSLHPPTTMHRGQKEELARRLAETEAEIEERAGGGDR